MKLVSTRDKNQQVDLTQALLSPSANFGGLFTPEKFPKFDNIFFENAKKLSYSEIAIKIIKEFDFNIDIEIFKKALKRYQTFDNKDCPVEIKKYDENLYIEELFHGPTRAFKDMALQPFGSLLSDLANSSNQSYLIMCATSGDTGPATLETFKNEKNIKVVCLYPANGTSEVQRLQMTNIEGNNLKSIGIKGNFDDTQRALKNLLCDEEFKKELSKNNLQLSAANSVNFGRILFQIIYYFYSYIYLLKNNIINKDETFDAIIPSGNFGNALGAYYAKKMGVKIRNIRISSNSNNILTELFINGTYNLKDKKLIHTISPAMDILISSNVERLLFSEFGDVRTKELMDSLSKNNSYSLSKEELNKLKKTFIADFSNDDECSNFIKEASLKNILIDPHTATCFKLIDANKISIIYSTAHWVKFTPSMVKAINNKTSENEKEEMIEMAKKFNEIVSSAILNLFDKEEIHKDIIEETEIKNIIINWIKK